MRLLGTETPFPFTSASAIEDALRPKGLTYVSSWVDTGLQRCYQVMETGDRDLLDQWIANCSDIVQFKVVPVISSAEAAQQISPKMQPEY